MGSGRPSLKMPAIAPLSRWLLEQPEGEGTMSDELGRPEGTIFREVKAAKSEPLSRSQRASEVRRVRTRPAGRSTASRDAARIHALRDGRQAGSSPATRVGSRA